MISCHDEVLAAKKILNKAADSLDKEGILFDDNIKVGIMIEVPSAVLIDADNAQPAILEGLIAEIAKFFAFF